LSHAFVGELGAGAREGASVSVAADYDTIQPLRYQRAANPAPSGSLPYGVSKEVAETIVRNRILALIDYIFSLQVKQEAKP
jgi:hypothetical protein